ncbi:MAG: molybdopterin oxidoreductase family protein, partial [Runella slithyformis]
ETAIKEVADEKGLKTVVELGEAAFYGPKLDFMVSIDIYLNETTRHAHLILPPATGLEVAHYDLTFNALAIRNVTRFSEPLFQKAENAKYDWEILQELTARLSQNYDPNSAIVPQDPHQKVAMAVSAGPYKMDWEQLRQQQHGIDLGPLRPCLPQRLLTNNKKICLSPQQLSSDMPRIQNLIKATHADSQFNLLLINRRHLRDNNSWMHNSERLIKGRNRFTLLMHPDDAIARNINIDERVRVRSRVGELNVFVELSEKVMRGVVSLPHGYGHNRAGIKLRIAQAHAGESANDLTDDSVLDELTGNAVFGGVPVTVESV